MTTGHLRPLSGRSRAAPDFSDVHIFEAQTPWVPTQSAWQMPTPKLSETFSQIPTVATCSNDLSKTALPRDRVVSILEPHTWDTDVAENEDEPKGLRSKRSLSKSALEESDYQRSLVSGYRQALDVTPNGLVFGMRLSMDKTSAQTGESKDRLSEGVTGTKAQLGQNQEKARTLLLKRHIRKQSTNLGSQGASASNSKLYRPTSAPAKLNRRLNKSCGDVRSAGIDCDVTGSRYDLISRPCWRPSSASPETKSFTGSTSDVTCRLHSAVSCRSFRSLVNSDVALEKRCSKRESRARPWREKTAMSLLRGKLLGMRLQGRGQRAARGAEKHASAEKEEFDFHQTEQERALWLSEQCQEQRLIDSSNGHVPPKFVFISSAYRGSDSLVKCLRRDDNVIAVIYDFQRTTFEDLLDVMRSSLKSYWSGCKALSVLFVCKCGPGYLYLLKQKVLTPQKLQRAESMDSVTFWRSLGTLMTKCPADESRVEFYGDGYLLGNKQGKLLMRELQQIMLPSIVHCDAPAEYTADGKKMLARYFDLDQWRSFMQTFHSVKISGRPRASQQPKS